MTGSLSARRIGATMLAAIAGAALLGAEPIFAQSGDAEKIVKKMSDYIASQKSIALTYDSDIEVITRDHQKITFSSSGTLRLTRPDKLRATRTGGYADVEFVFDGKTATLFGKNKNAYAQADVPGTTAALVERLRDRFGLDLPGADLISSNAYETMMEEVTDGKHIGRGVVDGVECEHLAFRTPEADWQIWVEVGEKPIPRKYVISSKHVTGGPQYTLRIKDWKSDPIGADAFAFAPPASAKKVDVADLKDIDEIPASAPVGGKK